MTIIPIFRREVTAAARQGRLQSERASFAQVLLVIVAGTFGAWYYWADGQVTSGTMARVVDQAVGWSLAFHGGIIATLVLRGAMSIARERDRRTLEFVLATPMSNAEVVLGKLASCLVVGFGTMAAGLPVMLLFHVLGGVELRLILLGYAGFASTIVFLGAWATWVSIELRDGRGAAAVSGWCVMLWLIGPFSLMVFLPRFGIRLPEWAGAANGWLISSSPIAVAFHLATGLDSWAQLVHIIGRMAGLQLLGTALFTLAAIARLRAAHRTLVSNDRAARRLERRRPVWRLRPRPPVGDDPILWRVMYTSRSNGLMKGLGWLLAIAGIAAMTYATYYFARPAFGELWRHGYGSGAASAARPEMNILVRVFVPSSRWGEPRDIERIAFNLFIRYATIAIGMMMAFILGGQATEGLCLERAKETWTSLLATPLQGYEILRSVMMAALWRSRWGFGTLLVLWTLGLAAGAVHPLGYLLAVLMLAASAWLFVAHGARVSVSAKDTDTAASRALGPVLVLVCMGTLPLLLPTPFNSVILGAGCLPLMLWTCLLSYRDAAGALASPFHSHVSWIGLFGGHMPALVFAAWILAIVGPFLGGLRAWRSGVAHFDRLVGRPYRAAQAVETPHAEANPGHPAAILPSGRSPLADPEIAV